MKIRNGWTIEDKVSGLRLRVIEGKKLDRLQIEHLPTEPLATNRDFWFDKGGKFDGTGTALCDPSEVPALQEV